MIVLYPVLVLSVIAGNGIVFADDEAPALKSANATAAASAAEAVPTTASPGKTDAPPATTVATAKDLPVPSKADVSKTSTNDNEDTPMADNYYSDNVIDKSKLASTLDRITKVLDANPSSSKGTAAVPLLPGKNYDFFLLKVAKHERESERAHEKPQKLVGRNLEPSISENSMSYPSSVSAPQQAACPCALTPPQVAPDLSALQNIYGNALSFNGMLDSGCPPGQIPVGYQTAGQVPRFNGLLTMFMMPAIDGIPVIDYNSLGSNFYHQYSPNSQQSYQPLAQNYYPLLNPYSPNIAPQYPENTAGLLQYPQNGAFPPPYPQNGAFLSPYPQVGAFSSPQNGGFPLPYPPPGATSPYPQNVYNPPIQYQQYDQNGIVPYGQSPVNVPFGNIQLQQPLTSEHSDFPESLIPYDSRYELKSAKSLYNR